MASCALFKARNAAAAANSSSKILLAKVSPSSTTYRCYNSTTSYLLRQGSSSRNDLFGCAGTTATIFGAASMFVVMTATFQITIQNTSTDCLSTTAPATTTNEDKIYKSLSPEHRKTVQKHITKHQLTGNKKQVHVGEENTSTKPAVGTNWTNEASTQIPFPDRLENGMTCIGTGVRMKYLFVKVYAVGTYMDPAKSQTLHNQPTNLIQEALLDPIQYPRVIRIVLYRELTAQQFTSAIIEALEPRMDGKDSWALDDFRDIPSDVTLPKGFEYVMNIQGDTLTSCIPGKGYETLQSKVLCRALCDVYFGDSPISPTHKEAVMISLL